MRLKDDIIKVCNFHLHDINRFTLLKNHIDNWFSNISSNFELQKYVKFGRDWTRSHYLYITNFLDDVKHRAKYMKRAYEEELNLNNSNFPTG